MSALEWPPPGGIQHVAALCDASPASMNAAWRAALVARDLSLPLRLVFHSQPRARAAGVPATLAALQVRAKELLGVRASIERAGADAVRAAVPHTRCGLLVAPGVPGNPMREIIFGTPAERLLKVARGPVLVVKRAAQSGYRRVFVASDLGPRSAQLVAAGAALGPRAQVAVFHALGAEGLGAASEFDATPQAVREYRMKRAALARRAIESAAGLGTSPAPGDAAVEVRPFIVFGAAAHAIGEGARSARAELLVMGKRRRGLLADLFPGSVTRRVLASTEADVLVLALGEAEAPAGAGPVFSAPG